MPLPPLRAAYPKPICLFIAPIRDSESETRRRYELVYTELVVPAANQAGMDAYSVLSHEPGMITSQIFSWIRGSHMIVADLTTDNTCVGYELAYAHSIRRCTSVLMKCNFKCPFDLKDMKRIEYDDGDLRNLKKSIDPLATQMRHFAALNWVSQENPIAQSEAMPPPVAAHYEVGSLATILGRPAAANPSSGYFTPEPSGSESGATTLAELSKPKRYGR